tara:strand:+ start:373 stop:624 length:252 start_codon:yes stop_codon:yes gene_type:complete
MIKAIVNDNTVTPVRPFPKLMILNDNSEQNDKLIVLFKNEGIGTVLTNTQDWSIGDRDTKFAMNRFEDFHGSIQLENGAWSSK